MKDLLILVYGIVSYLIGVGGLVYFILFVGGWDFLPIHIESGTGGHWAVALLNNFVMVLVFGLQHSIMARPGFKKMLANYIPDVMERSTYVLISGLVMFIICICWRPIDGYLWKFDNALLSYMMIGIYLIGWAIAFISTFMINHFDLFGLQQVYFNLRNIADPAPSFNERWFYKVVRHPLQSGILIGIWATPVMSMTHLSLSVMISIYILIGLFFEERDLVASLGQDYQNYKDRVPKLIPGFGSFKK